MYTIKKASSNSSLIFLRIIDEEDLMAEELRLTVAKEFAKGLYLEEKAQIDDEALLEITERAKLTQAVLKALDAVSNSNMSRYSLVTKLRAKYKIEKEYAEAAADYVVDRGYIDEGSQALREAQIAVRSKGRGKGRIAADLSAKGYTKEAVNEALSKLDSEEIYEGLVKNLSKKVKGKPEDKNEYMKIVAWAVRLGHSKGDIERALGEIFED